MKKINLKTNCNVFIAIFLFLSAHFSTVAQHTHNVKDIFLVLPDSIFTKITQLNFADVDSFPMTERESMLQNYEAQKKLADSLDPRFKISFINETNHLLRCSNNELNLNLKIWMLADDEELIAVDGNYKDDWTSQTVKFYKYKGGKLKPANPLAMYFPISLFFEKPYLDKQQMDEDFPIPNIVIDFSPTSDDIRVRMQREMFDPEYFGEKGQLPTKVEFNKKKREWIIYSFKEGKFEIVK